MVAKVALESVKAAAKIYIRDASVAYSSAFVGGVIAGAGFVGLKEGFRFGVKLPGYAKSACNKVFSKKNKQDDGTIEGEYKPEDPQE